MRPSDEVLRSIPLPPLWSVTFDQRKYRFVLYRACRHRDGDWSDKELARVAARAVIDPSGGIGRLYDWIQASLRRYGIEWNGDDGWTYRREAV